MKNNTINHIYKLCDRCVTHSTAWNMREFFWVLHSFFQSFKLFGLPLAVTCSFSPTDSLLLSYFTLIRSKLEYTLPAWSITTTNANKVECVQWKFAALSLSHFFLTFLTVMLLHLSCCSYILYKWQGITLMLFFLLFVFFQDLNFVLPW